MDSWFELILLMVAAAIAVANKALQVSREHRRRTVRKMEQEQQSRPLEEESRPLEEESRPLEDEEEARERVRPTRPPVLTLPPVPVPERPGPRPPRPRPAAERPPPLVLRPPAPPPAPPPRRVARKTVRRIRVPAARVEAEVAPRVAQPDLLRLLRSDPERVRQAVLLREVLGPPRALRHSRRFR